MSCLIFYCKINSYVYVITAESLTITGRGKKVNTNAYL